ncbi:acyl-CoA dehydrogenase family protein [Streptomyces sp. NBS 14/10]|uniref:acyl-CoA dehydrogenase family protein n=1 Tax=Streptomyces sp. NBS 14/10 TaxID=1945643 RepID=UPI000B7D3265|nr:acyl-CoA dehydrogenase family protein [Streptomyces sp. NBS 14/10]KAK1179157.1 acyl-CoA dehydrogenase family protein [Streptomyces sp. NBS 14/10]
MTGRGMTGRAHAADVMNRAAPEHHTLDAEIERIRREARRRFGSFVLDVANPGSHFRNKECRPLDNRVFEQAGGLGLMGFSLPPEIGGEGRDKLAWGVVVEEVARLSRDPGFAVLLDISVEITELILSSGTPELIETYVPDLVAGRRFGVQGAYESRDPYDYHSTARLEGDVWVLNGAKRFLAGARFADLFVLFLRDEASNDMLAFLVEKDDPGVTPVHMDTMGMHTMGLGQVILHDVRLPAARLVWRADALSELNTYARIRRTMSACGVLGALDGVIENCVNALDPRKRGGRRVLEYLNVERSVGEMRMLLQSARASVYRALDGTRSPDRDPYFDEYATVAKHHASECALRVGQLVMSLQGGEAYMSAFPWERFMRDILGLISGQGSQEMLLLQLGQRTIVDLEGKRVREEAAERAVSKLADGWWALHAAAHGGGEEYADAVAAVVSAAGLDTSDTFDAFEPAARGAVAALLERAHALVAAVRAGRPPEALPQGPEGLFEGRLARLAAGAWGLLACGVANETGLLARLLEPCTVREAAEDLLPPALAEGLLEALVAASVVRRDGEGRYVADEGLERVLIGGPRASAFTARLRRALDGGARLRDGKPVAGRESLTGCGGEAAALADVLVNSLLGRLEGLPELLDRPGAQVGCAAGDGGRSAVELARHIPFVPVLALEPEPVTLGTAGGDGEIRIRVDDGTGRTAAGFAARDFKEAGGFKEADRLALAWLPASGLPDPEQLRAAVGTATEALLPGGWLVLPCPLPPKRPLGAAAARLDLALAGGRTPADGEVEGALTAAGLGHVRTAWDDTALGVRLIAARRPA